MENTENNRLIAEFMGYELEETLTDNIFVYAIPAINNNLDFFEPNELLYHSDWNWLMEVVDKIESIVWEDLDDACFNVTIGATKYCVIQDNHGDILEMIGEGRTKIESVYQAVVEFINWYNLNK